MAKTTNKPISKTKAKATRNTWKAPAIKMIRNNSSSSSNNNNNNNNKPDQVLLAKLMEQHAMESGPISFVDILKTLGMNDRNTGWRIAWKKLHQQGWIVAKDDGGFYTSGFVLTAQGIDEAATDEYKEAMKQLAEQESKKPQTNQEHFDWIKSKLMNRRGGQIFDLLLEHEQLSRKELASHLKISDRGAWFSYALQQLKDLGYAENVSCENSKGKKVRLTDKAFVELRPTKKITETTEDNSKKE